jgi:hypothetical protein
MQIPASYEAQKMQDAFSAGGFLLRPPSAAGDRPRSG